ncbi:MAG: TonB-dependent receptor, partial [Bacteroidota bacterium]
APEDSLRAGTVPWNPKDQFGYDVNLRYRPSDSLRVRYGFRSFSETVSLLGDVRRPQFRPYVEDELYDTRREDHSLAASLRLSLSLNADLIAGWNTFDREKMTVRRDLEPDTTRLVLGGQDTTRYVGQLVRLSVATTDERVLGGQFGLEYRRESGSGGRILDTASQSREPAITNLAAWAALRYQLSPAWTVEATARVGHNSRYQHPVVPAVHLLWRPTEQWRWRLGYATGFRAPAIQELFFNFIDVNHYIIGSPSLAAERSRNLRLQGEWTGNRRLPLTVDGTFFYNRIQDRITIADLDGDARFTFVNLAEFTTYGSTLQLRYVPSEQWAITAGGALTRVSNQATSPETDLPEFLTLGELRSEVTFTPSGTGLNFRLDHRYIGRRDRYVVASDGAVSQGYIGDYHLLHLTAQQTFWQGRLTLTGGVKNLLNRDRVPVTGGGGGGAHSGGGGARLVDFGRNFFVGLRLRL